MHAFEHGCPVQGLQRWEESDIPFTVPLAHPGPFYPSDLYSAPSTADAGAMQLAACLAGAQGRGLLVVGELKQPADRVAALQIAAHLGWPVVADVLSGGGPCLIKLQSPLV